MMHAPFRCWLLICAAALTGCREKYVFDARTVETAAGEAVLRQVFADCPVAAQAKTVGIVLGEAQDAPSEEFRTRFANLGPRLLKHTEIFVRGIGGKARVQEKTAAGDPGELVLLLQLTELKTVDDHQEAVAAWAYKDDMLRRHYIVKSGSDGKFTISPGDVIEKKATAR